MTHRAKTDGLRLLRCINDTQAQGQERARVDPPRAAQEIGVDVGSERYHHALRYLIEEAALLGDEHTSTETGTQPPGYAGHAVYFFTRRAVKLLGEGDEDWTTMLDPDNPEAYPEPY